MTRSTPVLIAVLASLVLPASAGAVSVGHSGWSWGNPLPQGNSLSAIEFIGARGYAAGQFGTLLRTDDAGATWSGIATGITSDLRRIRMVSPETIVIGGACTVRRSDNGGQSFTRLPWTSSDENCTAPVSSLAFPSGDVGYLLLEDGSVLRSADGGRSWSRRTAVPGTRSTPAGAAVPTDIAFTAADTGVAVTTAGQIFRTTDGGGSWTLVHTGSPALNGLWFPDAATGYAVGTGGTFVKSTDGGATWTPIPVGAGTPPLDFTAIRCADPTTCLAVTAGGDQVIRTADGGTTFTSVSPSTEAVFAAAFSSATRAVAVGIGGATVVSDDAGQNWAAVGGKLSGDFAGLEAISSTTAFAFGSNGALARTVDGGRTWTNVGVSTPNVIVDVAFPTAEVGFALDETGQLLRTDNGGSSWSILNTGTSAAPEAVAALDPNTILLVGPRGVRRSTNGGGEFLAVGDRTVSRASLDEIDVAGGAVYAYDRGGRAIALSTDRGRNWRGIRRLPTRAGADEYDWVSARAGFAIGADRRLYRTGNGGRSWVELPAIANSASSIAFSSAREGYVHVPRFAGQDLLLRTTDGGRTFRPQLVQRHPLVDVEAPGGGTDFLLGAPVTDPVQGRSGSASLFFTTSGGDQGRESALTLRARRPPRRRSRRRPPRTVTVVIDGRLVPPEGGERIRVSMRPAGRGGVRSQIVTAAANGGFTTSWRVRGRTLFVAQWTGDDDRRGAGSRVLSVTPR